MFNKFVTFNLIAAALGGTQSLCMGAFMALLTDNAMIGTFSYYATLWVMYLFFEDIDNG